jgi:hypothetical protein
MGVVVADGAPGLQFSSAETANPPRTRRRNRRLLVLLTVDLSCSFSYG